MEIKLLVLHRKESYPGELLPEVMASVDEGQMDEIGDEANAWAEITLEVPTKALYPKNAVEATITSAKAL